MKAVYPIILSQGKGQIVVFVPDFNINTQGQDNAHAMEMARDAIGLIGIDMEDDGEAIPVPSDLHSIKSQDVNDIVTLIDVDFTEYRRKNDMRTVKKNCTIPSWLNYEAEKAGINFSAILRTALEHELNVVEAG